MFRKIYARIWPVVCLAFGLQAITGPHLHFEVLGLDIMGHDIMWFVMAFAHADVFTRGGHEH